VYPILEMTLDMCNTSTKLVRLSTHPMKESVMLYTFVGMMAVPHRLIAPSHISGLKNMVHLLQNAITFCDTLTSSALISIAPGKKEKAVRLRTRHHTEKEKNRWAGVV